MHPKIQRLIDLYEEAKLALIDKDFEKVKNMLERNFESNDINVLKTLMIITHGFKDHAVIKDARIQIVEKYNQVKQCGTDI